MSELKTILMIDVDSTREQQIMFSKPETEKEPETREDAYNMVMGDIKCLTYGLATLINVSHENGFADKDELLNQCIAALKHTLEDIPEEIESDEVEGVESIEGETE